MNREQKKAKKTAKDRARRRSFLRIKMQEKLVRGYFIKQQKVAYRFERLQNRIERERKLKKM